MSKPQQQESQMDDEAEVIDLFGSSEDEDDEVFGDEDDGAGGGPVATPAVQRAAAQKVAQGRSQRDDPRVVTNAQEIAPEMLPGYTPTPVVQLLAVWDNKGRPMVARSVNGNLVEAYRPPTSEEWELLKSSGRMVRGGIGDVAAPAPGGASMKKLLIGGLALAAIGGGLYYYVKKREDSMEEDVDELD